MEQDMHQGMLRIITAVYKSNPYTCLRAVLLSI
jgi:hypothetical protein